MGKGCGWDDSYKDHSLFVPIKPMWLLKDHPVQSSVGRGKEVVLHTTSNYCVPCIHFCLKRNMQVFLVGQLIMRVYH